MAVSDGVVEGDFLAGQSFEFGDELVFAPDRGETVVPVRSEVGEVGGGAGEQVPGDGVDGVAGGDQDALLAAAPGDPLVANLARDTRWPGWGSGTYRRRSRRAGPGQRSSRCRDLIELGDLGGIRGDGLLDSGGEGVDLSGQDVDPGQHQGQHEGRRGAR